MVIGEVPGIGWSLVKVAEPGKIVVFPVDADIEGTPIVHVPLPSQTRSCHVYIFLTDISIECPIKGCPLDTWQCQVAKASPIINSVGVIQDICVTGGSIQILGVLLAKQLDRITLWTAGVTAFSCPDADWLKEFSSSNRLTFVAALFASDYPCRMCTSGENL